MPNAAIAPLEDPTLSTAAFTQYVSASSKSSASQQAFQSLQQGLAAGNLAAAQLPSTYQSLSQNLSKSGTSQNAQLQTDLTTLGSALSSGNLQPPELRSQPSRVI